MSRLTAHFFGTKFSHKTLLCWNSVYFTSSSSCISCTTWTRTGSACTRSRYENFICHIVLSVSIRRKSSVLSRLFFSLCWNTQRNNILMSIENSSSRNSPPAALFLFPLLNEQKTGPDGKPTLSAHPARFSPDDKFSKQRVACKKRFGLLLTQQPEKQF